MSDDDDYGAVDELWPDIKRETSENDRQARFAEFNDRLQAGQTLTADEMKRHSHDLAVTGILGMGARPVPRPTAPALQTTNNTSSVADANKRVIAMLSKKNSEELSLGGLANTIRVTLKKSDDYLLTAGKHLAEARTRVANGESGLSWKDWLRAEKISVEQARVCLKIAVSTDPDAEVAAHREEVRQRVEKHRSDSKTSARYVTAGHSGVIQNDRAAQARNLWAEMAPNERLASGLAEAAGASTERDPAHSEESWLRDFRLLWERCPGPSAQRKALCLLGIDVDPKAEIAIHRTPSPQMSPDTYSIDGIERALRRRR